MFQKTGQGGREGIKIEGIVITVSIEGIVVTESIKGIVVTVSIGGIVVTVSIEDTISLKDTVAIIAIVDQQRAEVQRRFPEPIYQKMIKIS